MSASGKPVMVVADFDDTLITVDSLCAMMKKNRLLMDVKLLWRSWTPVAFPPVRSSAMTTHCGMKYSCDYRAEKSFSGGYKMLLFG